MNCILLKCKAYIILTPDKYLKVTKILINCCLTIMVKLPNSILNFMLFLINTFGQTFKKCHF